MSEEDYSAIEIEESTRPFVKSAKTHKNGRFSKKKKNVSQYNDNTETEFKRTSSRLGGFPSFQSALRLNFVNLRNSFRKLNCFKNNEEEAMPMVEMPRHKSIDIGVGLARRVSLFIFTRRTICVHPYHPYTPEQSTRKLYFCFEDKYAEKNMSKH